MRKDYLPYYVPHLDGDDIAAVVDSMRNGWLTSGPKVQEFETAFSALSGVKHSIAVNSCTSALHLALVAVGVGPGDEVVMPSFTFVAGAECVKQQGAKPVFCDIDESTLCITREAVESATTSRTKVIMPMHYGGQPAGVREIAEFAKQRGICVIEDAAHALGTIADDRWPGFYSDAAAFSFYATKNITTAEGGMLLTNRDDLAAKIRILALHGMDRDAWRRYEKGGTWEYDVVSVGYKYNLPDMAAALGVSQLRKLPLLQARRDRLAELYLEKLKSVPGIRPLAAPPPPPNRHSWCVFAVANDESVTGISRDQLVRELREQNIGTSVHFIPTHRFSAYQNDTHGDLSVTNRLWRQIISLPLYPSMTEADVNEVVDALASITDTAHHDSTQVSRSAR